MRDKKLKSIILIIFSTLFISIGQLFWKFGADQIIDITFFNIITNKFILLGFLLYLIATYFMIKSFKYNQLTIIYPFLSLALVWLILISIFILKETISIAKIIGIILITLGLILISTKKK